jgi:predicted DNA-binding ribbon-helix-helix protein
MMEDKTKRVSFSLEPEYYELLRQIAKAMHTNMTDHLRRTIDEQAVQLGLTPISPILKNKIDPPPTPPSS